MSISNLFHSDPTRQLEEVQKVNARERAETDVAEFYETKSAERVLTELGDVIDTSRRGRSLPLSPRDLRIGKTHLLKLIGLVADTESEFAHGYRTRRTVAWVRQPRPVDRVVTRRASQTSVPESPRSGRLEGTTASVPHLFEAIGRNSAIRSQDGPLMLWIFDGICWDAVAHRQHDGPYLTRCSKSGRPCGGGSPTPFALDRRHSSESPS